MCKHILVAVGPSCSDTALATGIARARECNARLTAIHVIDSAPWWAGGNVDCYGGDALPLAEQLARVIQRRSETLIEDSGIEGAWQTVTLRRDGMSIGRVIAQAANRFDADLIVLGPRKHTFFGLGANHVRNAVSRHTACEVLIASQGPTGEAAGLAVRSASDRVHSNA